VNQNGNESLGKTVFDNLPLRFAKAAEAATVKIREFPEVLGFILAGSVANGTADGFSDLDFYIVTNGRERWRGCWLLEETPVEYFFNPAEFLYRTIQNDAAALHMLADGVTIVAHPELEKLQILAREILSKPPVVDPNELEFIRFNTMECVLETRSAIATEGYPYILPQALVFILKAIYQTLGWWEVKPKSILQDLQRRNPKLADLAKTVLEDSSRERQQMALETLASVVTPLQSFEYKSQKQIVVE
jgi:hypothetical protein